MKPSRGEVWFADLSPARDHEQAGVRPVVVVSTDDLHDGASRLVITVPGQLDVGTVDEVSSMIGMLIGI